MKMTAILIAAVLVAGMLLEKHEHRDENTNQAAIVRAAEVAYANRDYRLAQNLRAILQIHERDKDEEGHRAIRLWMAGELNEKIDEIVRTNQ